MGIDVGITGGISILSLEQDYPLFCAPIPITPDKEIDTPRLGDFIDELFGEEWNLTVGPENFRLFIEKTWSFAGQGLSSTFTFGKTTGILTGAFEYILNQKAKEIAPQTWQRHLLGPTEDTKKSAIAFCKDNFPKVNLLATKRSRVPHLGMVDSLCVASYGKKFYADYE